MPWKKTIDGGATWTPMTPPTGEVYISLEDVSFCDVDNGWIVGGSGAMYHTTNGGTTWTNESATAGWPGAVFTFSPTAAWAGDIYGGILTTTPVPAPPVVLKPVYRFFNLKNGTHFYTDSETEKAYVQATWPTIYNLEGPAYWTNPANNTSPLYRFYNRRSGSHFYTASWAEAEHVAATWPTIFAYDGPTYLVSTEPGAGRIPVYRFFNLRNGSHFFTASAAEADMVIATWPTIYRFEGPAFWIGQ